MTTPTRSALAALFMLLGSAASDCQAQTARPCDTYVTAVLAADILGQQVSQDPGKGQYGKEQNLEWHTCEWISYHPPLAPGAPRNPATLAVSVQRFPSTDAMRKSQFTPQERGPKVRIERISRFGELGAAYTSSDRNSVVVVGSKGTRVVSVSVDMGWNAIRTGTHQKLERIAEKLWREL